MPARFVDMDAYTRMSLEDKHAVEEWVYAYVPRNTCFAFELAADGDSLAARFHVYDVDKSQTRVGELPIRIVDVFGVAPCPVA